jgi:hypothetical protein
MKAWIGIGIFLLAVLPALAQDEGGGGGGLFGEGDVEFSTSGARGGGRPAGPGPVDRINDILTKGGQPLTAEQRGALQALLDAQMEDIRAALEPSQAARAGDSGRSGGGQPAGAGRGGGTGAPGEGALAGERRPPNPALLRQEEIYLAKLMPVLTAEQQAVWKKHQNDQIRAGGGYPALRLALEEAGAPPTAEQDMQLQAQFQAYNQQLREMRMAAGPGAVPDAAKAKEIETQHLAALVKLLNTEQRKALLEWRRSSQGAPQN